MGRFAMVLLLAGLAWWGYSTWIADEGLAGESGKSGTAGRVPVLDQLPPARAGIAGRGQVTPEPEVRASGSEESMALATLVGTQDRDPLARLADEVKAGEPAAMEVAFSRLREAAGGGRQVLASALREGVAASVPEEALRLLGGNNSFLHTPEGRAAGARVIELAGDVPDERALGLLTGLVELAMGGPISPEDTAAKNFVSQAYVALQKPVKRHLFDPTNLTRARSYQVQAGDALGLIARKFSVEHGLKLEAGTLAMVNRITNPNSIRVGQVLKLPMDPIQTVVEKRSFLMAVYLGPTIIRLYWVGHGEDDITPETEFTISDKIEKPDWFHPDGRRIPYGHPDNVLGEFFVKFTHPSYTGFGAHGTDRENTIGTMRSMGCIRMYAKDIEEYFHFVPRGSKVLVRARE